MRQLMAQRPPVPPKDTMIVDMPTNAISSGSKRKRYEGEGNDYHTDVDASDYDEHTPKRSRPHFHQSDASASEDNAGRGRLVRKKGSRNLSNLNLRHAARTQTLTQASIRESRFQEGSLTDKPSEKPPSFFTRMTRGESRNPAHVDALMEDYHGDGQADREFAGHDEHLALQRVIENEPDHTKKDESKGFFQFGRQLAASFKPVALWKTIWGQTKEEIAREQMMEEEARRAKQKADAEMKYAEMKRNGQLGLQLVGAISGAQSSAEEVLTPQDSAVAFDSLQSSMEPSRSTSAATVLRQSQDMGANGTLSDHPEGPNNPAKGLKGRLTHLKKPSLINIKSDLKRMKSDMNLTGNRESSSSISPIKNDFDVPALKRSTSRLDLKKSASKMDLKKQQKLSKRVSDLESKLSQARKELDEALVEASPMPKLSGKYERFTPSATMTRPPKFQPGKLPSLPSERILMAEPGFDVTQLDEPTNEVQPRKGIDLSLDEFMVTRDEDEGEDTIKASRARPYPARAQSLFNLRDSSNHAQSDKQQSNGDKLGEEASLEAGHDDNTANENMDPNSITELGSDATPQAAKPVDYASLDAKLKALDANVKTARKSTKPKKRKSGADDDKTFKAPRDESDDELEWTPNKKQRKTSASNQTSPTNKRTAKSGNQRSPPGKAKANGKKATPLSSSPASKSGLKNYSTQHSSEEDGQSNDEYSADEREDFRASVTSQVASLDPVHEEEEEAVAGALNDTPTVPTRNPARSNSPQKRVQPGVEEQMLTRAAQAAQEHPGRKGRGNGSPPPNDWTKTTIVKETVMVTPGSDGVPGLPRGATGSFESLDVFGDEMNGVEMLRAGVSEQREEFQWPDDVF